MRGLTLFLMLFVNDLYEPGVPSWLVHTKADIDGMGLADWVFPGFLFMVGMSVPFAFAARRKKGADSGQLLQHILLRTVSLLIIGVMMLNGGRVNAELTGINHSLWSTLVLVFIFLVWNSYPDHSKYKKLFFGLKLLGIAGLIIMAAIFRGGEPGHVQWLRTGWWGILGLIGWGYLASSISFLLVGERLGANILITLFFVVLNIFSQLGWLSFLDFAKPVFGIIIDGNVPSIVMSGLVIGLLVKKRGDDHRKLILWITSAGIICLLSGFVLRHWFILSKIYATPSWGMLCNGISMLVFALLFYVVDVLKKDRWTKMFLPAGRNSLTTYLAPSLIYYLIWGIGMPVLIYKQDTSQILAVGGSLVWAFAMIGFAVLLARINIRLRL
jgi:predicted acyltransferase